MSGAQIAADVMRDGYAVSQEFADFWGGIALLAFVGWLAYRVNTVLVRPAITKWLEQSEQASPRAIPSAEQRPAEPPKPPLDWPKAVRNAINYVAPVTVARCASTGNVEWRAQHLSGLVHSVRPEPYGLSPRLTFFEDVAYWIEDIASLEHARLEIVLRAHDVQRCRQTSNPSPELLEELRSTSTMRYPESMYEASRKRSVLLERDVEILEGLLARNALCSNPSDARALVAAEIRVHDRGKADYVRRSESTEMGPLWRAECAQNAILYDDLLQSLGALEQRLEAG